MKPVMPVDLDRMGPLARLRLSLEVLLTYLRVRWEMRSGDAEQAVGVLREWAGGGDGVSRLARRHQIFLSWRLAQSMGKVLRLLPADSRCLFSSLTLACMLERRGIRQSLLVAVRPQPFSAHAWIEVGDEAVLPGAEPGYEKLLEL